MAFTFHTGQIQLAAIKDMTEEESEEGHGSGGERCNVQDIVMDRDKW